MCLAGLNLVRSDLWEKTSGTPSPAVHAGRLHFYRCSFIFSRFLTLCTGDAAILNDGDDIGNLKSSIYIPWLRKTKYLAVESLVQRRSSDHRGALALVSFFAVSDSFGLGGAPQKDSSVHSVPSDVVNQSFRDVETTLPGPHQQGLEPVAEYSIVPKQGHAPHRVTLVCCRCFCLCFLMCLVHCGCFQAAGNKSTFNFNSAVLLFRSRH